MVRVVILLTFELLDLVCLSTYYRVLWKIRRWLKNFEMSVTTDYILEPDTSLLKVQFLFHVERRLPNAIEMGSFFMVAKDIAEVWNPTGGRLESGDHSGKVFE